MKIITALFLTLSLTFISKAQTTFQFAIIGDYGKAGTNELNVSNLVKSWNPEFIITLGDNNYELGEQSTIDTNIGKYYSQFIFPYTGSYGTGDTVNRFYPSLGNHDWYTDTASAYLNYFSLPGNERYYDFIKGNIHFFAIDSDPNEPDGVDSNSVQALWLKNSLAASSQKFNLVYFHHPPYSSGQHGNNPYMNWPFKRWGADAVLAGHDHTYERIILNEFLYIVNGLGGKSIYTFNTPVTGSAVRYNNNYGAMLAKTYEDSLVFRFYTVTPTLRDYYKLLPAKKTLLLTSLIEGFYDSDSGLSVMDTIKVLLRKTVSPYEEVDSAKVFMSAAGTGTFEFNKALNSTPYYLVVKHRNSIETWSSSGNSFSANNLSYDFTGAESKAYGNNLKLKGSKYCIYGGDINQDGYIDGSDVSLVDNDVLISASGYLNTDLSGDNFTDINDLSLVDNNSFTSVIAVKP
ncbi:MAG: metallophosphoesterase [Ignavibacteria bacterium]|nr:metallophosphoesterase [Ignavibacteria bacterium]